MNKHQLKQAFLTQVKSDFDYQDYEAVDELLNRLLNECDGAQDMIFNYLGDDLQLAVMTKAVGEFYPEDESFDMDGDGYIITSTLW